MIIANRLVALFIGAVAVFLFYHAYFKRKDERIARSPIITMMMSMMFAIGLIGESAAFVDRVKNILCLMLAVGSALMILGHEIHAKRLPDIKNGNQP